MKQDWFDLVEFIRDQLGCEDEMSDEWSDFVFDTWKETGFWVA